MVDHNQGQLDIVNRLVFPMPELERVFDSFGWQAHSVDATRYDGIFAALEAFKYGPRNGKPTAIICHSAKGPGAFSDFLNKHQVVISDALMEQEMTQHAALRRADAPARRRYPGHRAGAPPSRAAARQSHRLPPGPAATAGQAEGVQRGPGINNFDVALFKRTAITEPPGCRCRRARCPEARIAPVLLYIVQYWTGIPQASMKTLSQKTPSIQSLDRGLLILDAVAKSQTPVSLGQLTGLLQIDRSSVFRLANTLKRRGFLANPSTGKDYILGPSIWRLSRRYDWSNMLATLAHDLLKQLAGVTSETVHLAVREGRSALFVDDVASNHVIAVSGQAGELVPLYCTAHGKALLADFVESDLKALFGNKPLQAYTKQTLVSMGQLARACAEIRARGYATDDSEFLEGVRCVAAPIRDRDGAVIASVGISAPLTRFPKERYPGCGAQVCHIARQIGERISAQQAEP